MAAVTSALLCFLKAGDHIVAARAMFGSCLYVAQELCPALRHRLHAGRRPRYGGLAERHAPQHQGAVSSRRRPTRRSTWSISPRCRRSRMPAGALVIVDNVFATP
jgi:O-succinylhomoserine sulfhydrylase